MKEFANTIISKPYKWSNLSCFVVSNLAPAMPVSPTMVAITNAIYHATGVRIKALPVNPHKLLSKIRKTGRHVKG